MCHESPLERNVMKEVCHKLEIAAIEVVWGALTEPAPTQTRGGRTFSGTNVCGLRLSPIFKAGIADVLEF